MDISASPQAATKEGKPSVSTGTQGAAPRPSLKESVGLTLRNGVKYIPLLQNLIARELKKKYRSSVLGYVWCVLNPLLVMIIMTVVFSRMFDRNISNYPVYLFCGRMFYSVLTGGCSGMMKAFVSNRDLIHKTRVPYYVFPLANFCSTFVDFFFTLIAFAIVMIFTGCPVSIHLVAFPLVVLEAALFTFGLGLLLSIANLFVRDVNYIWTAFTVAWLYITPVFYPMENLSEEMQYIIGTFNPLYWLVAQCRNVVLDHVWPDPVLMGRTLVVSAILCVLGLLAYAKSRNNIVLYV